MANLQKGVSLQLVRVLKLRYRCLLKGFTVKFYVRAYVLVWLTKYCWDQKKEQEKVDGDGDGPFQNLRSRLNCRREGCRSLVFFREKVEKLDDVEYIRFIVCCCKILPTPFLFNHCDTYNTTITPNATYTGLSIPFPPYSYYHSRHMCAFRLIQLETERGL